MKAARGEIALTAATPGGTLTRPGVMEDRYRCRRDAEGREIPQAGQPAIFVNVTRGANPGGSVGDTTLYARIDYTFIDPDGGDQGGGYVEYDVTNGGRFVFPPCDKFEVSITLTGVASEASPTYAYRIISAWEQPSSGSPGFYTTRPIVIGAASESAPILIPPGTRSFFAEVQDVTDAPNMFVRKYTSGGRLISRHQGAEDTMPVSGAVGYVTYSSVPGNQIQVNFLSAYS